MPARASQNAGGGAPGAALARSLVLKMRNGTRPANHTAKRLRDRDPPHRRNVEAENHNTSAVFGVNPGIVPATRTQVHSRAACSTPHDASLVVLAVAMLAGRALSRRVEGSAER